MGKKKAPIFIGAKTNVIISNNQNLHNTNIYILFKNAICILLNFSI